MSPRKPLLIELENAGPANPGAAPPPPEADLPEGRAMRMTLQLGARQLSFWARLGWAALIGFLGLVVSVAAWDFVTTLVARNLVLGWLALGLLAALVLAALAFSAREIAGFRRLARIDRLRGRAMDARLSGDRADAAALVHTLDTLYAARPDLAWARQRLTETAPDQMDAEGLLDLTETTLLAPLDELARREIEGAARQVALLTAMLPIAVIDLLAALVTNLRMIRRVAELYGGRAGTLGSIRLLRGVIAHLLATGAVAVGDDMIGSVASGGLVSKLSRRFGEGIVNGALTARLGIAAIEVCRPLPFHALPRPRTGNVLSRALTGLFDRS
ncbi:MAG: YcjF family protein [Roseinatronobacter sp.]